VGELLWWRGGGDSSLIGIQAGGIGWLVCWLWRVQDLVPCLPACLQQKFNIGGRVKLAMHLEEFGEQKNLGWL
jgi:hypothetical protein